MVVCLAVNQNVVGSSPTLGAIWSKNVQNKSYSKKWTY